MNKDELYEQFRASGSRPLREAFNEIIVPHLAIPRSLKDDRAKKGEHIILLGEGDASFAVEDHPMIWWREAFTHWIPFPQLPKIDKDEQEFEQWIKDKPVVKDFQVMMKDAWMAARGKQ